MVLFGPDSIRLAASNQRCGDDSWKSKEYSSIESGFDVAKRALALSRLQRDAGHSLGLLGLSWSPYQFVF